MSTVDKVKIGLDECRMLALGAQVLIGFQFQGVFQPGFDSLPTSSKAAQIVGLLLLIGSLGVLIVPSTQHIIAEGLQASRRIETILTRCLDLSLLPLAAGLSIDVGDALRTTASFCSAIWPGRRLPGRRGVWFGWPIIARFKPGEAAAYDGFAPQVGRDAAFPSRSSKCSPRRERFSRRPGSARLPAHRFPGGELRETFRAA